VEYWFSEHARVEMRRRNIGEALLEAVLSNPEQIVSERGILKAYQSKCDMGGKMFLLRVIVNDSVHPAIVVTAYRTTKIEKYWRKP
jgi:hypothetical protein